MYHNQQLTSMFSCLSERTQPVAGIKQRIVESGISAAVLVIVSLLVFSSVVSGEIPMTGTDVPALSAFDTYVVGKMEEYQIPGAALAVSRNGRLVLARGYGYADTNAARQVHPDTLFRVASLAKPVTAVAVNKLVEDGLLQLDEKVFVDILPEYNPLTVDTNAYTLTDWVTFDTYLVEYNDQNEQNIPFRGPFWRITNSGKSHATPRNRGCNCP